MGLSKDFFDGPAEEIARRLLGCTIIHKLPDETLKGKIIETEAYFGSDDPASRASNGKTKISRVMWEPAGTILVYVVHSYNLFNLIVGEKGKAGAVLIRAVEPLKGIDKMKAKRKTDDIRNLCSGPGKFTQAFCIPRAYNNKNLEDIEALRIIKRKSVPEISASHRIGVREDLKEKYRFFVKDNNFVS